MIKKTIMLCCILVLMSGCVSSTIQKKVEESNVDLLDSKLYTDKHMLKQLKEINRLFAGESVTVTGKAAVLNGNFSNKSLREAGANRYQIDWQIRANTPQYISEVEVEYNLDAHEVAFHMKKQNKYPATSAYHHVKRHLQEEHMNMVLYDTIQEDDGYHYITCRVCGNYMGSYGRRFSEEFAGKETTWTNYDSILRWMKRVEEEALAQKKVTEMSVSDAGQLEEKEYAKDGFYYKKTLLLDDIIYTYTPFSIQGTHLQIGFLSGSVAYPKMLKKTIVDRFDSENLILTDYELEGALVSLVYNNVSSFIDDEYETYDSADGFKKHSGQIPMRMVSVYDNQMTLKTISVHIVDRMIGKNGMSQDMADEVVRFAALHHMSREDVSNAIAVMDEEFLNYYVKKLVKWGNVLPPTKLGPLHGTEGALSWSFILRGTMYGGKGWVEYTLRQ